MAVKAQYSVETEIPEPLKKDYVKKGAIFVLQVEGGDPDGYIPEAKLSEFRQTNIDLAKQLKKFDGLNPEEVRPALAELEELRKSGGDHKTIVDAKVAAATAKMSAEMTEKNKKLAELEEYRNKTLLDGAITAASREKVNPLALDDMLRRGRETFRLEGEMPVAFQGDTKILGKDGKPLTVEAWVDDVLSKAHHLALSSSGGGAKNGTGGSNTNTNPFAKETVNYTEQGKLIRTDRAKAEQLAAQAGVKLEPIT